MCHAKCRFNRDGWKFLPHVDPTKTTYSYLDKAEVELDTDSNLNTRVWSLRTRVIQIRRIIVKPEHRRQGLMGEILAELIDQLPSQDIVAVLNPMEGNERAMIEAMTRTYERLGFHEVDWSCYLSLSEWHDFEKRNEHKSYRPKMMARPADDIDHKTLEKWRSLFV